MEGFKPKCGIISFKKITVITVEIMCVGGKEEGEAEEKVKIGEP